MSKRLWQYEQYWFSDSNYFSTEVGSEYESWAEFLEEWANMDDDMNYFVNWHWDEDDCLKLLCIGQRKGLYNPITVKVKKSDEAKVKKFLKEKFEFIKSNFEAVSNSTKADGGS